jgi:UDP-N-acetylmuramoyl-L-alanyl-D-glutamate--2,6-diaminopimelate ligase
MVDLINDSRKIKKGDTFIAIKGIDHDGHDYIKQAIENGASKIICEHGSYNVETIIVEDSRGYLEEYLLNNYYPLIKDINLVGVTGTNGKTTTCYLVYQMLRKLGKKCAYIGTIGFYLDDEIRTLANTTPDILDLYNMFLECREKNIETIVMEVSSQAIDMNRVKDLKYDIVAFTNLTQDHLDYHLTMNNYLNAKQKLFKMVRNEKIAIINIDDEYGNKFLFSENNNITIGLNGKVKIVDYKLFSDKTVFVFNYNDKLYNVTINMAGKYNIYNYLTSLFIVHNLGISIDNIIDLNMILTPPPGRMDIIAYNTNSIIVDYAHTPDAVLNILNSVNEYKKKKVITVIGCGGNRDRTKRPIMGDIATKYSDYVIFTNDNPRNEDEKVIMTDIISGVTTNNYKVIYDRNDAITAAMKLLNNNDILLILGKGHENYQIIKDIKYHFDDKETVLEYINQKEKTLV